MRRVILVLLVAVVFFVCSGFSVDRRKADAKYFTIIYEGQSVTVSDKSLNAEWYNVEARDKFAGGKNIYERARAIDLDKIEKGRAVAENELRVHFPEFWRIVAGIEKQVERAPFSGDVIFSPNAKGKAGEVSSRFSVVGARAGKAMDMEYVCMQILRGLAGGRHVEITAPIKPLLPKSEKEVLGKLGLRSSFSTKFDASNGDRAANIARSINCFNGLVILPRERVSFNKIVGARTVSRGYREANVILDGEFVPGVGGGVCQASTTIFNAVIEAGLSIVESHNHSLPISYVPLGRDAMVSSVADLVFENNTGSSIYIEAGVLDSSVRVRVYGARLYGLRYVAATEVDEKPLREEVSGVVPEDLASNPMGYKRVVMEKGMPSYSARTYIDIYKGDRLVNRKLVRKSNYKGRDEVIRYDKVQEQVVEQAA